jgi:protein ImuB
LRFTPKVAQVDDALVLEVSGSERLFGGRQPLLHAMLGWITR